MRRHRASAAAETRHRTTSGCLFGGLASSRTRNLHIADGVWQGGLSGVAFSAHVPLVSRLTQGCQPVGPTREVTACERNIVVELDGQPARRDLVRACSEIGHHHCMAIRGCRRCSPATHEGPGQAAPASKPL